MKSKFNIAVLMPFRMKIPMEKKLVGDASGWKWIFDGVASVGKNLNLFADKDGFG